MLNSTLMEIEKHPLAPFLSIHAKVLLLGSFPPPKIRWKMDFYYPNFQNDMWRIMGIVFFKDKNHFLDTDKKQFKESQIHDFLLAQGIAIYDAATAVIRHQGNASDKHLEVIESINLSEIMQKIPECEAIITTGEKATEELMKSFDSHTLIPKIGQSTTACYQGRILKLYRLPSSSRAYPLALEQKARHYADCFKKHFANIN